MTDEQFDQLTTLLERIAVALEPKRSSRPTPDVPAGGGRRAKMDQLVEEKVRALVKPAALNPQP